MQFVANLLCKPVALNSCFLQPVTDLKTYSELNLKVYVNMSIYVFIV